MSTREPCPAALRYERAMQAERVALELVAAHAELLLDYEPIQPWTDPMRRALAELARKRQATEEALAAWMMDLDGQST